MLQTQMLQPGFAVFFSLEENRRKLGCNESPPTPPSQCSQKGGKKMKTALRFYCAITNNTAIMLSLIHCTALPQMLLISLTYCRLNCLAQIHFSPPQPPGLSGILASEKPVIPQILTPCHRIIIVLARLQHLSYINQSPVVCFIGNDRFKNEFRPERPVRH